MHLPNLLSDKTIKPKQKTETLSQLLLEAKISPEELITFAQAAKDPAKATCIEALEFATKQQPALACKNTFQFVTQSLQTKAPRIKWESAKVIGNTAHLFQDQLPEAIQNLLDNTQHEGTVVRWSAAFALGEILKLQTRRHPDLLPALETIMEQEEKNSIKKIYLAAIKQSKK